MLSQLHSVFTTHTLIEREVSLLIASGTLRKLQLRGSAADGGGGEISGAGGDFGLILSETYSMILAPHAAKLASFTNWIAEAGRTVVSISHSSVLAQGVQEDEVKKAVEMGFLTMDYSLREAGYTISVPGSGKFVKNLRGGRRELSLALKRQKYRELLEKVL